MLRVVVTLVLGGASGPAWGELPQIAEVEVVATRYHENPARLDALREGLEQAARTDPDVDTLIALARVCFIWGDIRATTVEQKLEAYDRGRRAARLAVERAPRSAAAHFWLATNTAREEVGSGAARRAQIGRAHV